MFKKLNKMKIGARLKKSFRQIILIFGILSALVVVIMLYTINNYGTILDNYAYPQGDIAMAMNESAEVRAASRGIRIYNRLLYMAHWILRKGEVNIIMNMLIEWSAYNDKMILK